MSLILFLRQCFSSAIMHYCLSSYLANPFRIDNAQQTIQSLCFQACIQRTYRNTITRLNQCRHWTLISLLSLIASNTEPILFILFFRGCLFYGPPGTGKTLVARALANECSHGDKKLSFFMRKGADCLSKWVGESERQLRLLFDQVGQRKTPAGTWLHFNPVHPHNAFVETWLYFKAVHPHNAFVETWPIQPNSSPKCIGWNLTLL